MRYKHYKDLYELAKDYNYTNITNVGSGYFMAFDTILKKYAIIYIKQIDDEIVIDTEKEEEVFDNTRDMMDRFAILIKDELEL